MHSDNDKAELERGLDLDRELYREDMTAEDVEAIKQWQNMADVWHDEVVPPWHPPKLAHRRPLLLDFQQWFPMLASTAALVMVTVMFFQQSLPTTSPNVQRGPDDYATLPVLPKAQQAAMVESVMAGTRDERQQELQAALAVLKHHMDKRTLETEQSLQFVIANQLQGQRELEDLYQQVKELMDAPGEGGTFDEVSQ